jgi:tRNA dimethylallyltransferase
MLTTTKIRTQQYARYQLKWIRKQLLPAVREAKRLGGDVEVYVVRGGTGENGEEAARRVLKSAYSHGFLNTADASIDFLEGQGLPGMAETGHPAAADLLEGVYGEERHVKVPDTAELVYLSSKLLLRLTSDVVAKSYILDALANSAQSPESL